MAGTNRNSSRHNLRRSIACAFLFVSACAPRAGAGPAAAAPAAAHDPSAAHVQPLGATAATNGRTDSLGRNTVPRFFPSYTTACRPHETLKGVMQNEINPALSKISVALFHDTAPEDERMQATADAAAALLGCAAAIAKHGEGLHRDSWPSFDHFLHELVVNSHALQTAAMEDDASVAIHWYYHLKQSCAACHARFVQQ